MVVWKDIGNELRVVYTKWDSGANNSTRTVQALRRLGIVPSQDFLDLLEQYARSRNLPFTVWMKCLQSGGSPDPQMTIPSSPHSSNRDMHDFVFKTYSDSVSQKAPFGTSEVDADDPHLETQSLCSSVRCGTLRPSLKKQLTPTAFIPSFPNEDESASQWGSDSYVPPHMQGNMSVFEPFTTATPPERDHGPKEGVTEDNGDIITWSSQVPSSSSFASAVSGKRHYSRGSTVGLLNWAEEKPIDKPVSLVKPPSAFLEHSESRPLTTGSSAHSVKYPFATESDDLASARTSLQKQRIHRYSAQ